MAMAQAGKRVKLTGTQNTSSKEAGKIASLGLCDVIKLVETGLLGWLIPAERLVSMLQVSKGLNRELVSLLSDEKIRSSLSAILRVSCRKDDAERRIDFSRFKSVNVELHLQGSCVDGHVVQEIKRAVAAGWGGPATLHLDAAVPRGSTQQATTAAGLLLRDFRDLKHLKVEGALSSEKRATDSWSFLTQALQGCTCLTSFDLVDCRMDPDVFIEILKQLICCKGLKRLSISGTPFGDKPQAPVALAWALRCLPELEFLEIEGAHLGEKGLLALCKTLPFCRRLKSLDLDADLELTDDMSTPLALSLPRSLTDLRLSQCDMEDGGAAIFATALSRFSGLEAVDFGHNHMGSLGVAHMARGLWKSVYLKRLVLRDTDCGIGGCCVGTTVLAEAMRSCWRLTDLDLGENCFTLDQLSILAKSLMLSPSLRQLHLDGCDLGPAGAQLIADILPSLPLLSLLHLSRNDLQEEGLATLLPTLAKCERLRTLHLGGNALTAEGGRMVAELIGSLPALENVYLEDNEIGLVGALHLAEAIRASPSLQHVSLTVGVATGEGEAELLQAAKRCRIAWHDDDSCCV
eukprot:CAMPEP_0181288696 /NCGR_PEP_ID=MMETSP1101-20121128/476_1 /TAXON_ID=46948 /ORGANISM="Rhodomonas abbreviata, Strain Caron Lab Isolate" /LENGTH=575 /DNA_ID=CAMNT_0023392847 /DNA_START=23 /DNA_END=1750 /DNA_ORIENTATION=-